MAKLLNKTVWVRILGNTKSTNTHIIAYERHELRQAGQ